MGTMSTNMRGLLCEASTNTRGLLCEGVYCVRG